MRHFLFWSIVHTVGYFSLFFLFSYFFDNKAARPNRRSFYSILSIVVAMGAVLALSFNMTNLELANRILHAFGGGFIAFYACFRVVQDSGLEIDRTRFFVFSAMAVTTMGVANEIFELVLQTYGPFLFSATITDTWLDLLSNTVGIFFAAACLVPLISRKNK